MQMFMWKWWTNLLLYEVICYGTCARVYGNRKLTVILFVIFKKMIIMIMSMGCRYLGVQVLFKIMGVAMLALIGWKVGRTQQYSLEKKPEGQLWCSSSSHLSLISYRRCPSLRVHSANQTTDTLYYLPSSFWLCWKGVSVTHGWTFSSTLHWLCNRIL